MPGQETIQRALQVFRQHHGWLRTSQALQLGIAPRTLYFLRDAGIIVQRSRGLYQLAEMPVSHHLDLLTVAQRVSKGVVCLLSALAFYEPTTHIPHQVYLALPLQAEKPRLDYPPLRLFWLSEKVYRAGITTRVIEGIVVRIYSPEKSIADAFKFRHKIGLDVALEALRNYRHSPNFDMEALMAMARVDRVERILKPYLEALQ